MTTFSAEVRVHIMVNGKTLSYGPFALDRSELSPEILAAVDLIEETVACETAELNALSETS